MVEAYFSCCHCMTRCLFRSFSSLSLSLFLALSSSIHKHLKRPRVKSIEYFASAKAKPKFMFMETLYVIRLLFVVCIFFFVLFQRECFVSDLFSLCLSCYVYLLSYSKLCFSIWEKGKEDKLDAHFDLHFVWFIFENKSHELWGRGWIASTKWKSSNANIWIRPIFRNVFNILIIIKMSNQLSHETQLYNG